MRITIVAWGGHGDIRPHVSLALGLQKAGHEIQFATYIEDREFVTSFEIKCLPMEWEAVKTPILINRQPFITISQNSDQIKSPKNSLLDELWRVCQNAEAIIFNGPSYPCYHIAEKLNIPCYAAPTQPHHQTSAFPHPFVTNGKSKRSIDNWLSYPFFDRVFWQYIRQPINRWRQEKLQLPPLSVWEGVVNKMKREKIPFLYSYSPAFLPKPADWKDDNIHITGYWFLDVTKNWQPPQNLIDFLSAGDPPIYISNIWHQEALGKEIIQEVYQLTQQRIIVHGLDDNLWEMDAPDKIFYLKGLIPHKWLFPKMAAIVHHGGCGTTMSSLRAGVPMIITPFKGEHEHFFWSLQIKKSGLGIPIFSKQETVSAEKLAKAIQMVINDQEIKKRAENISKQMQLEDGVNKAIEAFNAHL